MQPIYLIMVYYLDQKNSKNITFPGISYNNSKDINPMSLAQRMHFWHDVFQMTAIALVSVINHRQINKLHQFCYTLYIYIYIYMGVNNGNESENIEKKLKKEVNVITFRF